MSAMRIILYTGKGGVGKTTASAATALRAARLGYRTLVMSTDPAHSLGDAFDLPLSGEPRLLETNLWAQELDVTREVNRHWGTLQEWLRVLMAWRGVDDLLAEEMATLPGMEEVAGLLYLLNYYETGAYDVIVVDTAPTGETVRLLSLPDVMRWWLRHIFPLQRIAARVTRPVLRTVTDLPLPDDAVFAAVKELLTRLERTREVLADPSVATVRLVLNPEKMVVKEAQRAYTYLSLYGYPCDLIVCNRLLPSAVRGAYFETWQRSQDAYMALVGEAFAPMPILRAPLLEREVVGAAMLKRFGDALFGDLDPVDVLYQGHVQEVTERDGVFELALLLPFASKEEVRLQQVGDELVVQVGSQKRNVVLPRLLTGAESVGARLEGQRLVISFQRPEYAPAYEDSSWWRRSTKSNTRTTNWKFVCGGRRSGCCGPRFASGCSTPDTTRSAASGTSSTPRSPRWRRTKSGRDAPAGGPSTSSEPRRRTDESRPSPEGRLSRPRCSAVCLAGQPLPLVTGEPPGRCGMGEADGRRNCHMPSASAPFLAASVASPRSPGQGIRSPRARRGLARSAVSTTRVTGPSFTSDTRIAAPKRPVSTRPTPARRNEAANASTSGLASSGGAAPVNEGRRPRRMSAIRVN